MRALPLVVLLVAACAPPDALVPYAECFIDADCTAGARCEGGTCARPDGATCEPGRTRCASGHVVETCDPTGTAWEPDAAPCPTGCDYGRCIGRTCRPFELACNGLSLLICRPDGAAFEFFDQCRFACREVDGAASCARD